MKSPADELQRLRAENVRLREALATAKWDETVAEARVETLAEQIIRAGQKARGELPAALPPVTGIAAKILEAAELARAGGHPLPEPTGLAAKILAAGRKGRGEIA